MGKFMGVLVGSAFALVSGLAFAAPIDLSKAESQVEFLAIGKPSVLKIRGKLSEPNSVSGTFQMEKGQLSGSATLPLEKLDTGISLRNEHMKEKYLQVKQFPNAVLTLAPVTVGEGKKSYDGEFKGKLSLHGVEKDVTGKAKIEESTGKWSGSLSFTVALSDFSIDIPSYMGITVSKTVDVEAKFKQ